MRYRLVSWNIYYTIYAILKILSSDLNSILFKKLRSEKGLPLEATDVEIEILAQSWSEHCKHKIFSSTIDYSEKLKPSKRKEIEIVDLLNKYKNKNKLSANFISRGGAWLDTGSIEDFYNTSSFVSALENRQGLKIACLEEIALNNKWIGKKNIVNSIKFYGKCSYSQYLSTLLKT